MMIRRIFTVLALIVAVFGFFTGCPLDIEKYTVTFEANGGSPVPQPQTVTQGGKVTQPAAMTKEGYRFGGWYKEAALTNGWNFISYTVTANITLYAKWDSNYYTVDFSADGGTPAPQQQSIAYGGNVTEPPTMSKENYTFEGWYKEEACTNWWSFDTDMVTGNITLYAKWDSNYYYTVDFSADGGSPAPQQQNIAYGGKVAEPPAMSKENLAFEGWYKEEVCINRWSFDIDTVTGNITLYAKWGILVPGANFNTKMRWLDVNVQNDGAYIVEVDTDVSTGPITLSYRGKDNITITMIGIGANRIVSLSSNGSIFTIEPGITLILDELELRGRSNNTALIRVNSSGNLILNNGTKITGNLSSSASYGGGVYVAANGTFTMSGGEISGNQASSYGGGVYVAGGTFTMSGGEISGNRAGAPAFSSSASYGGGVYVAANGTFTMSDGKISGNTSSSRSNSYGGGVCVAANGTFTMSGGEISGNRATTTSSSPYGGGVYVSGSSIFNKTGGTIFGYTRYTNGGNNGNNGNVVWDESGVVQQNRGHAVHVNHSNTIYIMGKDTTSGPEDGLSFYGKASPPIWSGEWDY